VHIAIAYPGASADVLVQSTLIPLERAINGVPGMKYIVSDATSAGEATIQVVFELGTDPDQAVVNVKNRVDQVMNLLPELVQREGVVVSRVQPSMLMYVNLYSTDDADEKFLYNFATRQRPRSCSASPASAGRRSSAAGSTPCASGSTPTACAPTTSRPRR
jgi:HAE1 family hydrophobic/amphiphilic exporter-1